MNKYKFQTLTPKELERWVEKQTEKVLKKLPILHKELALYDDRTSEFYNLSQEEVTLMSKIYKGEIASGTYSKGQQQFLQNLEKYGDTDIQALAKDYANRRMEDFKEVQRIYSNGSEEDAYFDSLYNQLSDEDKLAFTKSKFFVDWGFGGSAGLELFKEEFGFSIHTMKLELWMESKGYQTKGLYKENSPVIKTTKITAVRSKRKYYIHKKGM